MLVALHGASGIRPLLVKLAVDLQAIGIFNPPGQNEGLQVLEPAPGRVDFARAYLRYCESYRTCLLSWNATEQVSIDYDEVWNQFIRKDDTELASPPLGQQSNINPEVPSTPVREVHPVPDPDDQHRYFSYLTPESKTIVAHQRGLKQQAPISLWSREESEGPMSTPVPSAMSKSGLAVEGIRSPAGSDEGLLVGALEAPDRQEMEVDDEKVARNDADGTIRPGVADSDGEEEKDDVEEKAEEEEEKIGQSEKNDKMAVEEDSGEGEGEGGGEDEDVDGEGEGEDEEVDEGIFSALLITLHLLIH